MADHKRGRGVLDGDEERPRGDEEGDSECKSAKAIRLLREVTILLSEKTDQPSKHVATGQVGASASNALHNFRTIFAPYRQSSLSLSSSVPTKKNPVKPKFFQPKETWTHDFFCLYSKEQVRAPSRAEKFDLQQAGLGRKKICFHSKTKFPELRRKLEEEYPKLSQGGGFELMRTGHQGSNTTLTTIIPPASGYSVPFLRDSSGLGQALAYIRPLQRDLDRNPVVKETLESADAVLIDCLNCGKKVALSEWHAHDSKCEGGASCSGSFEDSCIHDGSAEINGESFKSPSLLNRGCLVETLREMFPGETEEDLLITLTKNNFDLEISVNELLCCKAGDSTLTKSR